MELQKLFESARKGRVEPVHVVVGTETFLVERAATLLRKAALGDGPPGFNDDVFHGSKTLGAQSVIDATRTLPMMASTRFVRVRDVEALAAKELDRLAEYCADPVPTSCLVLTGAKLDGRSRLIKVAKKGGFLTEVKELKPAALRSFAQGEAKARGHALDPNAATELVDAIGADLSGLDDALERLSLFVGSQQPIDRTAVEACVTRLRPDSIWALVDGVGLRDRDRVARTVASLLADREQPLRILAMVSRQLRTIARVRDALVAGLAPAEAAKRAGAPPFKARELSTVARRFTAQDLRDAFATLAEADLALKSSKRPGGLILEESLLRLCTRELRMRVPPPPLPIRSA